MTCYTCANWSNFISATSAPWPAPILWSMRATGRIKCKSYSARATANPGNGGIMIMLLDAQTDAEIGEITQEQLNYLIDDLEEESAEDTDYYINLDTLDMFAQQ